MDECVPNGPARWALVNAYNDLFCGQTGLKKRARLHGALFGRARRVEGPPTITTEAEALAEINTIFTEEGLLP
jgi:hypothetical protein